jgi:hypothetical protein
MLAELCDSLNTIGSLPYNLQSIGNAEQRHQSLAHHVVIFDN